MNSFLLLLYTVLNVRTIANGIPITVLGSRKDDLLLITQAYCTVTLDNKYYKGEWTMRITTDTPTTSIDIEKFVETQKRQNTYYLESLFTEGPGKIGVVFYLSATTSDTISGQCDSRAESKVESVCKYGFYSCVDGDLTLELRQFYQRAIYRMSPEFFLMSTETTAATTTEIETTSESIYSTGETTTTEIETTSESISFTGETATTEIETTSESISSTGETTTTEIETTSESILSTGETTTEIETTSESIPSTSETTTPEIETTSEAISSTSETTEMVTLTPIDTTSNSLKTILIDNRGDDAATTTCLQGISTESLSQTMMTQQPSTGHQYITVTQNASACLYPTIEICQCSNHMVKYTKEEILEKTQRLVSELMVDKKGTSLAKSKKISATDNRPSSQAIGSIGVMILFCFVGIIILSDIGTIIRFLKSIMSSKIFKKRKTKWWRNKQPLR